MVLGVKIRSEMKNFENTKKKFFAIFLEIMPNYAKDMHVTFFFVCNHEVKTSDKFLSDEGLFQAFPGAP